MCGRSREEVGLLSGLSAANRKGTTKADASSLKPNSLCRQRPREEPRCLSKLRQQGPRPALGHSWLHQSPCPHSSHFARMPLTQPEVVGRSLEGFMLMTGKGKSITSWSRTFSHSTQKTGLLALLKYSPLKSFAWRTPSRHLRVIICLWSFLIAHLPASYFFVSIWAPPLVLRDCAEYQALFQALYFR